MDRIFETQSTGYGQFVLGIARATKAKVYRVFTALKLPRLLASALTWGGLDQHRIDAGWLDSLCGVCLFYGYKQVRVGPYRSRK